MDKLIISAPISVVGDTYVDFGSLLGCICTSVEGRQNLLPDETLSSFLSVGIRSMGSATLDRVSVCVIGYESYPKI